MSKTWEASEISLLSFLFWQSILIVASWSIVAYLEDIGYKQVDVYLYIYWYLEYRAFHSYNPELNEGKALTGLSKIVFQHWLTFMQNGMKSSRT